MRLMIFLAIVILLYLGIRWLLNRPRDIQTGREPVFYDSPTSSSYSRDSDCSPVLAVADRESDDRCDNADSSGNDSSDSGGSCDSGGDGGGSSD